MDNSHYKELYSQLSREFELLEKENQKLLKALKPFADAWPDSDDGYEYSPACFKTADIKAASKAYFEATQN